jgi:hypothetical protein
LMSRYPKMAKSPQTWKRLYQNSHSCCSSAERPRSAASCIRLYSSWSTRHCRHRRREIQPPTCKACCRAADRRPSSHPAPHGYRSRKGCSPQAHLFVLPSYSENFGNTVLEAMRRGLPIVVTPEVGAAEIVRTSGAGLVVAGDLEPLSSAIRLLTAHPILARSMGEAGRGHAAAFYVGSRRCPDGRFVQQRRS